MWPQSIGSFSYFKETLSNGGVSGGAVGWGGTRRRSWLRHYATYRKVAGSIPDGVIGIFLWHNPSGRTMAQGSTQPLTEMSTRNISCGWRWPVRRAENLTTFMGQLSWNLRVSTSCNAQGLSRAVMGLLNLYLYFIIIRNFIISLPVSWERLLYPALCPVSHLELPSASCHYLS
jgi:hypothetical protein